ncbi:unnamed protein product [Discosporangium mesarthrocarpum]
MRITKKVPPQMLNHGCRIAWHGIGVAVVVRGGWGGGSVDGSRVCSIQNRPWIDKNCRNVEMTEREVRCVAASKLDSCGEGNKEESEKNPREVRKASRLKRHPVKVGKVVRGGGDYHFATGDRCEPP